MIRTRNHGYRLRLAVAAAIGLSTAAFGVGAKAPRANDSVRQDQCPAVANYDLAKIAKWARRNASPYRPNQWLEEARVPASAKRRPPPDASFVIRVRLPSGGLSSEDESAVVWRERDGSWWGWRTVHNDPNATSPPPPPPTGSIEEKRFQEEVAAEAGAGYEIWYSPDGVYEGRLDAELSARLESVYADPCRKLEPDFWPWDIPLLRPENGKRSHTCEIFPDDTPYFAEFTEDDRGPRNISLPCGQPGTLNGVLVTWSVGADLPRLPARRLTHEEIDAIRKPK